jgi:hypothetical protein
MQIGIRIKLLAGFAVVALFTGALGWYAAGAMEHLNAGQRILYGDVFGGTHLLARWVDQSWEARDDLLAYLLTDDAAERRRLRTHMAEIDRALDELAREMDAADIDREDVQTLAGLTETWGRIPTGATDPSSPPSSRATGPRRWRRTRRKVSA